MGKIILQTKIKNKMNRGRNLSYLSVSGIWFEPGQSQIIEGAYPATCRNEYCVKDLQADLDAGHIEISLITNLKVARKQVPTTTPLPAPVAPKAAPPKEAVKESGAFKKVSVKDAEEAADRQGQKVVTVGTDQRVTKVDKDAKDEAPKSMIPMTDADAALNQVAAKAAAGKGKKEVFNDAARTESTKDTVFKAEGDSDKTTVTSEATVEKAPAAAKKAPAKRKIAKKAPAAKKPVRRAKK